MKFTEKDLKAAKNLAMTLKAAKFNDIGVDEILVMSGAIAWFGGLLNQIEQEAMSPEPAPVVEEKKEEIKEPTPQKKARRTRKKKED